MDEKQKAKELKAAKKAVDSAQEGLDSLTLKLLRWRQIPSWSSFPKPRTVGEALPMETVKLHEGDAENLALWNQFLPLSISRD